VDQHVLFLFCTCFCNGECEGMLHKVVVPTQGRLRLVLGTGGPSASRCVDASGHHQHYPTTCRLHQLGTPAPVHLIREAVGAAHHGQRNDTTQTKQASGPYIPQFKMGAAKRAIYLVYPYRATILQGWWIVSRLTGGQGRSTRRDWTEAAGGGRRGPGRVGGV